MAEYKNFVVTAVTKAFLRAYDDLAREIFSQYLAEIELARSLKRKFVTGSIDIKRDSLSGKPKEPNMKLIRSIEENVPIA